MFDYNFEEGYSLFSSDLSSVVRALDDDLKLLRGARIFLTGGTGFFGIWLIESLLYANEKLNLNLSLTILTRSSKRFLNEKAPHLKENRALSFLEGDLLTFKFPEADDANDFTHIIHAASETNLEQSDNWAKRHLCAALDGTRRLLEMAKAHKTKSFLVTTSGAVYLPMDLYDKDGRCVEGPKSLIDYSSERIVYSQAKRMMEVVSAVEAKEYGFNALIARCFCFLGPYLPLEGNYAAGNFLRDALSGQEIVVQGDGTPLRSYLYPTDLVIWLLRILCKGKSGVPYNVGGELAVSIGDLAKLVAKSSDVPVKICGVPAPNSKPSAYLPNLDRIIGDLGVVVSVGLEEAILRTLIWHRMRDAALKLEN